eukprot:scaffold1356_cov123-Cylindrotheca_fusiformis.AAC.42
MARPYAYSQQNAGKGPVPGGRGNVASLKAKLNLGAPRKGQQHPGRDGGRSRGRIGAATSNIAQLRKTVETPRKPVPVRSTPADPNFAVNRQAIAAQLNFGARKKAPPTPQPRRAAPKSEQGGGDFAEQRSALAAKLNFRPPKPVEPSDQTRNSSQASRTAPIASNPGVSKTTQVRQVQPVAYEDVDYATQRAAIASKLTFGKHKSNTLPKQTQSLRNGPNRATAKPPSSNGSEFSGQRSALASKLNFRPPKPTERQAQTKVTPPRPSPSPAPSDTGTTPVRQVQPVAYDDVDYATQRAAVASKLTFGRHKSSNATNETQSSNVIPRPSKRATTNPPASNGSDFAGQLSAIASKLNFRPSKPAERPAQKTSTPPRARPSPAPSEKGASEAILGRQVQPVEHDDVDYPKQRGAIASKTPVAGENPLTDKGKNGEFVPSSGALAYNHKVGPAKLASPKGSSNAASMTLGVPQAESKVDTKDESSGSSNMAQPTSLASKLASKLKFRPTRSASLKPDENRGRQAPRRWAPEPVQERLGPSSIDRIRANHERDKEARHQNRLSTNEAVPMDPHIAALKKKLHLGDQAPIEVEAPPCNVSGASGSYDSGKSHGFPQSREPVRDKQHLQPYSVSNVAPPSAETEPELKYVRSYSIAKYEPKPIPAAKPTPAPPVKEPFRQVIQSKPVGDGNTTIVLLNETYEWGTIPRTEESDASRGEKSKNKKKKKTTKLSSKKKGGCTIM